jgi:short-subunit dehydrogenase
MPTARRQGTALITGASAGIGATYADRLAGRGYNLILVARDATRLAALATKLRPHGVVVDILQADLATASGRAIVEDRLASDPSINMLVNNAGIALPGTLVESDPDRLEAMISLNVIAATRLAGAAARAFAARNRGAIINIASVLALAPERFNGAYSGTKAYLLNLTLSMHQELAGAGVTVQAVLPGATRTEIWASVGIDTANLPPESLMEVGEMVDAALAGFDAGELVTIPSLPDKADFDAYTQARFALAPNLSRNHAAPRYRVLPSAA